MWHISTQAWPYRALRDIFDTAQGERNGSSIRAVLICLIRLRVKSPVRLVWFKRICLSVILLCASSDDLLCCGAVPCTAYCSGDL